MSRSAARRRGWGAPMYTLEWGSFGLQFAAAETDLVLLVMNNRGVEALLNSKVKRGRGCPPPQARRDARSQR